tara:strand:+ start:162 stop:356 length:195 start_codon:yes stop_codon:yes gene_type:complete
MKTETIFWAYLLRGQTRHDRREYFEEQKSLQDFHQWLELIRFEIEKTEGHGVVIQNMGLITNKI